MCGCAVVCVCVFDGLVERVSVIHVVWLCVSGVPCVGLVRVGVLFGLMWCGLLCSVCVGVWLCDLCWFGVGWYGVCLVWFELSCCVCCVVC